MTPTPVSAPHLEHLKPGPGDCMDLFLFCVSSFFWFYVRYFIFSLLVIYLCYYFLLFLPVCLSVSLVCIYVNFSSISIALWLFLCLLLFVCVSDSGSILVFSSVCLSCLSCLSLFLFSIISLSVFFSVSLSFFLSVCLFLVLLVSLSV